MIGGAESVLRYNCLTRMLLRGGPTAVPGMVFARDCCDHRERCWCGCAVPDRTDGSCDGTVGNEHGGLDSSGTVSTVTEAAELYPLDMRIGRRRVEKK